MRIQSITPIFAVFLVQICVHVCATNQWVWMGGPNQINGAGYDDGKGNYSSTNVPQARSQAATWVTIDSNSSSCSNATFWMFGGNGFDPSGIHTGRLSDLWSFNGQQWRWVTGSLSMDQDGIYDRNASSSGSFPGARVSAATWTNANKILWMFGGQGQGSDVDGYLNDLWMYDDVWHWVGGSNTVNAPGVYGSRGIANTPYNWPGARVGAVTWTDSYNAFWMFGGKGWDNSGTFGILSDLWKYDSVGGWIWVSGPNYANALPVYGPKGLKSPTYYPGGRTGAVGWTGPSGSMWLFGGNGLDASGATGVLNDLWVYDKGKWGWMGGSNSSNDVGCYDPNCGMYPAPRQDATAWADESSNLWLFGGQSYNGSFLSDLWKFDYSVWTWVGGNVSNCGMYGTMFVESPTNVPGGRSRASGWKGSDNSFWMFAGQGFDATCASGRMNDVWRFTYSLPVVPSSPNNTVPTTTNFTATAGSSSVGTSASATSVVNSTTAVVTNINSTTEPQTVANSSVVLPSSTVASTTQSPTPAMLLSDNKIRTWFPIVLAFSICAFLCLVGIAVGMLIVWKRRLLTFGKKEKKVPPKPNPPVSTLSEGSSFTDTVSRKESGIVKVNVIPAEDVRFDIVIGKGSFGEVFKGDWDGIEVALKKLKTQSTMALEEFQEETRILRNLNHPNILRIYGLLFEPNGCNFIVTEYCSKGGMDMLLTKRKGRISVLELTKMALQVAIGMQYVHKNKIIHRDLAARNLLVSGERGNYSVKVSDFGMSYMGEEEQFIAPLDVRIPIRWSAPEVLTMRQYSFASDVFSFGITLWELLTFAELPYDELSVAEVHQNVPKGYLLRRPQNAPDGLWQFMLMCWDREPKGRPTFQHIVDKLSSLEFEVAAAGQGFDGEDVTLDEYVERRNHSLDYIEYSKSPGIISNITVT